MRAVCLQENLAKGLSTTARSVALKPQLPILSNILLATDEGKLKLSATNLEVGVNVWVGGKIEEEGSVTVPARVVLDFVQSLPNDRVELSSEGTTLKIVCGSSNASILGISSSEFPPIPSFFPPPSLSFNSNSFSSMVQEVCFAAATDEGRPVLGGVLLVLGEKEDVFVATDGFRLSLKKRKADRDSGGGEERKLILPARTLTEVSRIIGERGMETGGDGRANLGKKGGMNKKGENEPVGSLLALVTKESNQVIFRYGQADIVSRLIDGQFPNFEKIIPTSFSTRATFDKEDLLKAVKRASVFARDTANIVRFKVSPSSAHKSSCLQVNAGTSQVGETESEIEADVEGVENEIAFNLRFLLDLLNNISYERLSLETSGPLSPGVFRPTDDDSYLHIIMPVRLQQ